MSKITLSLISTVTVGAGGAASIDFTSIPQTGTDLVIHYSLRCSISAVKDDTYFKMNNYGSNGAKALQGSGSAATSNSSTRLAYTNGATSTSNTFTSGTIYIPNYGSTSVKSYSADVVTENNATEAYQYIVAGSDGTTDPVTSVSIYGNNFVQYSTASLYLIEKGSGGATV